ncbi:MAG: ABC transporter substrate-binding protein [Anaerolineae bacterium]|nr:ABC transporter substrate-binding protein [Anaerolineae bacterium]
MRRKFTLVLAILMVTALLAPVAISAQEPVVIRYPITTDPEHLNPFTADTIAIGTVTRNVLEGLTRYNPNTGEIDPALAESWDVSENDDGNQVYTFHLRPGVLFHQIDGVEYGEGEREVTADKVVWNYLTALSGDENVSGKAGELDVILGAAAYTAGEAEDVEGIKAPDDYTVEITLEQPDRLFLVNGMISITSPAAYEQLGEDINNKVVGTGPFQFVEWLRQDRLVLERNPDYWQEGVPVVDGIRFINYGDENTALLDYRENQLDFLFSFPSGQRTAVMEEFPDEFNEEPGLHVRYWGFNMETGFLAENKLVRQALSYSLDRVTAWDVFEEGARFPATLGMLPPAMPASTPATIYDFDLEKAAALLEEAGYPNGEGLPVIKIHLLESISDEAQVVVWQEALQSLGVQVEFAIEDGGTYWDSIVADDAMIFQNGWAAGLVDPADVFNFLILDGRGSMRYDNPEVNDLLRQAMVELDPDVREGLYQQVHDIVMDDAVVIPSAYSKVSWLQKPWVQDFNPGPGGTYTAPLWEVSLDTEAMPS